MKNGDLYQQLYKCRLCEKVFCPVTAYGLDTAINDMKNAIGRANGRTDKYKQLAPALYHIHHCDDGGIGFADFIGYEKVVTADEKT